MRIILDPDASHIEAHHDMKMKILVCLEDLVTAKDYEKLTISDICQATHISRQTFYKCFDSKNSIMPWFISSIHKEYFGAIGKTLTWKEAICLSFRFAYRRVNIGIHYFSSDAAEEAIKHIAQNLSSVIRANAESQGVTISEELEFQIVQWGWLFAHAIADWNAGGQQISGDTFGSYLNNTVPELLHQALELDLS